MGRVGIEPTPSRLKISSTSLLVIPLVMKELLETSQNERRQYFQEASARSQIIKNPIIIEKDF